MSYRHSHRPSVGYAVAAPPGGAVPYGAPPPVNRTAYGQPGPYPNQAYGAPPPRGPSALTGPPPGADPQLFEWFVTVDVDGSGAISAEELQKALVNGNWSPFDVDTCRMLMSIFDTDRSGTISFNEFVGLYKYIGEWQNVFRHFDVDRSGSIDGLELSNAMRQFGYHLSPQIISLVEQKYGALPGTATGITFDRFVRACVVVKTLTESFRAMDTDRDGWIMINYDQFMANALSAP